MGGFSNSCVASCKEADGIIPGRLGLDRIGAPFERLNNGPLLTLTSRLSRAIMLAMKLNVKLNVTYI